MKKVLHYTLLLIGFVANAQYTLIPDIAFEQSLVSQNIDTDGLINGKVLTTDINTITSLDVDIADIANLTGIQDFVNLSYLNCAGNLLTALDITKNTKLTSLYCNNNKITSLDLSKNTDLDILNCSVNELTTLNVSTNVMLTKLYCVTNKLTSINLTLNTQLSLLYCANNNFTTLDLVNNTALTDLTCDNNPLTSLNLTKNIALEKLFCRYTSLTTLDVTKNTALKLFWCTGNDKLTSLNLKNGTNTILESLSLTFNPALTCIQVDNVSYANNNWSSFKDTTATYNVSCSNLSVTEDIVFQNLSIYPNPAHNELFIDNVAIDKVSIYNTQGIILKTIEPSQSITHNKVDLSGLSNGVYLMVVTSNGLLTSKKIVID